MEPRPGDYQDPRDYPMAVPFLDGKTPPFYTHNSYDYGAKVARCKHEVYVPGMFTLGSAYACKNCLTYPVWPAEENPTIDYGDS